MLAPSHSLRGRARLTQMVSGHLLMKMKSLSARERVESARAAKSGARTCGRDRALVEMVEQGRSGTSGDDCEEMWAICSERGQ